MPFEKKILEIAWMLSQKVLPLNQVKHLNTKTMTTTFRYPEEAIGKIAIVEVTNYKFRPYVDSIGRYIQEIESKSTHQISLEGILTHDTILWTGYYINLRLLSIKASVYSKTHYSGVTLIDVI